MRGLLLCLVVAASVLPGPARAQLFSPGKLAAPHAHLEGLSNCTKCHEAKKRLSNDLCLECHQEIAVRVQRKRGYHGRMAPVDRRCERCHREHQGREFPLIDWKPKRFDHEEAGWSLKGAHKEPACRDCHDPRLVVDRKVRKLLAKPKKKVTYLGLTTRCVGCHFDEHRGQEGDDCKKCHGLDAWKPAKGFDHDETDFRLVGKHRKVGCEKCHATEVDRATKEGAFPAPVAPMFTRFTPVAHDRCTACHQDPHDGRFGDRCEQCHDESSWTKISRRLEKERRFHEKTRYPLRGAHVTVACRSCHLPLGRRTLLYRGLPFAACTDCHPDGHFGQIEGDCERCHSVEAFVPPSFDVEAHERTDYPLEDAHRAVACSRCHEAKEDMRAQVPDALARGLRRRGRSVLISTARLAVGRPEGCETCHQDPHGAQFEGKACSACHGTTGFSDLSFDHQKDSRFPLTGAHEKARCERCHQVLSKAEGFVRYRPLNLACAACHPDPHAGQFTVEETGATDCAACHRTTDFEKTTFDHQKDSRFPLTGKHRAVECGGCHPTVKLPGRGEVRRYRPLPLRCDGCHADFHEGAFEGLAP